MDDLRASLLPKLEGHRLAGLDAGPEAVYPFYDGFSLANLPASVCRWLGVPLMGRPLRDEILETLGHSFQHVILLLVDGLGLEQLEAVLEEEQSAGEEPVWTRLIEEAVLAPLTSISPSTTAAALTTLWTGVPPAQHGVMGYELWLKEYSMIANAITHAPVAFGSDPGGLRRAGFIAETFLPVPTLGPHLVKHGITPFAYHPYTIHRSSLSNTFLAEVKSIPYRNLSDLWVTLDSTLEANASARTYSYIYWGELDELSHRYGPRDERVRLELASFSHQFERFLNQYRARQRGDTLLLVTADHGHLLTPRDPTYDLRSHPQMTASLVMQPSGDNRFAYLYVRPGQEAALLNDIEAAWPGKFRLVPSQQALSAGLLGPGTIYPPVNERIGDWIAIAQGDAYWWWANKENILLGRHGGLSRTEMFIPLIAISL